MGAAPKVQSQNRMRYLPGGKGRFTLLRGGRSKPRRAISRRVVRPTPGTIIDTASATRNGVTTIKDVFSNGATTWVRFRLVKRGKVVANVKMSMRKYHERMRKSGKPTEKAFMTALAGQAAAHPEIFQSIVEHGKGLASTATGDLLEMFLHLS